MSILSLEFKDRIRFHLTGGGSPAKEAHDKAHHEEDLDGFAMDKMAIPAAVNQHLKSVKAVLSTNDGLEPEDRERHLNLEQIRDLEQEIVNSAFPSLKPDQP